MKDITFQEYQNLFECAYVNKCDQDSQRLSCRAGQRDDARTFPRCVLISTLKRGLSRLPPWRRQRQVERFYCHHVLTLITRVLLRGTSAQRGLSHDAVATILRTTFVSSSPSPAAQHPQLLELRLEERQVEDVSFHLWKDWQLCSRVRTARGDRSRQLQRVQTLYPQINQVETWKTLKQLSITLPLPYSNSTGRSMQSRLWTKRNENAKRRFRIWSMAASQHQHSVSPITIINISTSQSWSSPYHHHRW